MHQGWPKFVSHLWMATHDQGLAAVAYGPCDVQAKVAHGEEVGLKVRTDYPFDGQIRVSLTVARPTAFPLHFRIPGWAEGAMLKVRGRTYPTAPGSFAVIDRTWKTGDVVELSLPMRLRAERRHNQAVSILRGPLVFSLKIGEQYNRLAAHHAVLPAADWEILPATPWNYGLVIDPLQPDRSVSVARRRVGSVPFATEQAPVILRVKGRAIPEWQLAANSAGDTPPSPVRVQTPDQSLELIPYGSTRLRISEFPVIETVTP
jgi:hypothetical protein